MNKIIKIIITCIFLTAAIIAIISFIWNLSPPKSIIEVKTISSENLTNIPSMEGLSAVYKYKNDSINSLWKLHYIISNVGDKTIIGRGNSKNIINENLQLSLCKDFKILECKTSKTPFEIIKNKNELIISFLQWRKEENLELILYAEELNKGKVPTLKINDREILDGEVVYTSLQENTKGKAPLITYIPSPYKYIIIFIGLIVFGMLVLFAPASWADEFLKWIRYNRWKKSEEELYNKWLNDLISENKISSYLKPNELPEKYWSLYPHTKPVISKGFGSYTLGMLIIAILSIIPLLFIINI